MKKSLEIWIKNELSELNRIRKPLELFYTRHKFSSSMSFSIDLVIEELLSNIIYYAYQDQKEHEILLLLRIKQGELILRIEDDGKAFNPLNVRAPKLTQNVEERPIGGLGIALLKKTVDDIAYHYRDNKNCIIIKKKID